MAREEITVTGVHQDMLKVAATRKGADPEGMEATGSLVEMEEAAAMGILLELGGIPAMGTAAGQRIMEASLERFYCWLQLLS